MYGADMSSTAFIEPLSVIDFVQELLNRDVSSRPLSDSDRIKVSAVNNSGDHFFKEHPTSSFLDYIA